MQLFIIRTICGAVQSFYNSIHYKIHRHFFKFCFQAFDTEDCMISVDQGEATLLALDAGEVYIAGRYHSLVPIAQEVLYVN